MPRKFLFGTGVVRAFVDGRLEYFGKTLIDTSMGIEVSSTDVRGGPSNPLLTRYYHTSQLNLTITDAQFVLKTIAMNVGSLPTESNTGLKFASQSVLLDEVGEGTLVGVEASDIAAVYGDTKYVYYEINGEPAEAALGDDLTFRIEALKDQSVCVSYLISTSGSTISYTIPANYVPHIVDLYVTLPLFGDKQGEGKIGTVTIHVPKFQLNGSQTINLTSDGVANTSFSGSALASEEDGTCEAGGIYATVVQEIEGESALSGVTALAIKGGDFDMLTTSSPTTLEVYGVRGSISFKIDNSLLTFTSSNTSVVTVGEHTGVVTVAASAASSATISVVITDNTDIEAHCTVSVAEPQA